MTIDTRFYDLISHLWRGGKYSYFWTPNDGQGNKYSYWLTAPDVEVPKLFFDKDAYFGVHPSTIRRAEYERSRIIDIAAINCFYCEFDCATDEDRRKARETIKKWGIIPACVIDSGGGYHVYVLLRNPFILNTPELNKRAQQLQRAFVDFSGGEKGVSDLARVLRIPGTFNHKAKYGPNMPRVSIVEWDTTRQYELSEIEAILQPYVDQRNAKIYAIPPKTNTCLTVKDDKLLAVLFKSKNGADYQRLWDGDLSICGGDHSKCDQYLCDGLAWLTGRNVAHMDRLFRKSGLMRDKWNRDDYRKATLENAANSAYMEYDPFRGIDLSAIAAVEAMINNE